MLWCCRKRSLEYLKSRFYKLAFPPLSKEGILPHQTGGMKPVILISGILAGLLCLIGGSIWLLHSKRKKVNVSVGPGCYGRSKDRLVEEEPTEQKVSLVLLLGGFQIFDNKVITSREILRLLLSNYSCFYC